MSAHDSHDSHAHDSHASVFESNFDNTERQDLMAEDDEAWNGVTGELITIVTGGVILGALGVLMATYLT
jgi:hypothetical protein